MLLPWPELSQEGDGTLAPRRLKQTSWDLPVTWKLLLVLKRDRHPGTAHDAAGKGATLMVLGPVPSPRGCCSMSGWGVLGRGFSAHPRPRSCHCRAGLQPHTRPHFAGPSAAAGG